MGGERGGKTVGTFCWSDGNQGWSGLGGEGKMLYELLMGPKLAFDGNSTSVKARKEGGSGLLNGGKEFVPLSSE